MWFAGCGLQDVVCRMWFAGCGLQDVVCSMWSAGCGLQDVVCRMWFAGCGLEAVTKEKRITASIGNKIPVVQYLALLQFTDDFFFGALAKLRKETISSVVSFCPSVLMKKLGPRWMAFHEIFYLSIFRKSVGKIQGFFYKF